MRGPIDTLIVAGGTGVVEAKRDERLPRWIRSAAPRARRVASVCTGAFLLAEAGLLDGRRATTHWAGCDELGRRYPEIEVEDAPIFVRDGDVYTSAGVTAGIDLALALVEDDLGAAALATSRAGSCSSCAGPATRRSSALRPPGSRPTGRRCATFSPGSPTT